MRLNNPTQQKSKTMSAADSINPQFAAILKLMRIFQMENKTKDECFQNSLVAATLAKNRGYPNAYVKPVIGFYDRPYMEDGEERTAGIFVVHMVVGLNPKTPTEVVEPSAQYATEDVQYFDNWKTLERFTKISEQRGKFAVPTDEELGEGRDRTKVVLPPCYKALLKEFLEYKSRAVDMNELISSHSTNEVVWARLAMMKNSDMKRYLLRLWMFLLAVIANQDKAMEDIDGMARHFGSMDLPQCVLTNIDSERCCFTL